MKNFRKYLSVILLILLTPILGWRLNKAGYLPPLNYLFSKNNNLNISRLSPPTLDLPNYDRPLVKIIETAIDKTQTAILVEKSKYRLTLYYQQQPIKSYPIVLGDNPIGNKLQEGDRKTPEGIFKVRDLYPHSSWSKFIWLDYPNRNSWQQHLQAKKEGKINLFSSIGSEIGIHGVPNDGDYLIDGRSNWTWGCVSLKNSDIDELYSAIQVGTIVEIVPCSHNIFLKKDKVKQKHIRKLIVLIRRLRL